MKLLHKANVPPNAGHKLYCDNYFTLYKLLDHLSSKGFCATGTARQNRTLNFPLPKKKHLAKSQCFPLNLQVHPLLQSSKYRDNNVVSLASNFDCDTIGTKRIYSSEKKCEISVPQPNVVHNNYNQHMGGVDQLDQPLQNIKGFDPFIGGDFYLWTDLNEICTAYVKLNCKIFLFVELIWISVWFSRKFEIFDFLCFFFFGISKE